MTTREQLIADGIIKASRVERDAPSAKKVMAKRLTRDYVTKADKAMAILRKAAKRG